MRAASLAAVSTFSRGPAGSVYALCAAAIFSPIGAQGVPF